MLRCASARRRRGAGPRTSVISATTPPHLRNRADLTRLA
jgi:hypothetical protein